MTNHSTRAGMLLAAALLSGCGKAEQAQDPVAPTPSPSATPEPRKHSPISQEALQGKAFSITGAEEYVDFVHFQTQDRYIETLRGKEVARGDYILTPDGRLCFMVDDNAASNCWRQIGKQTAGGTIELEFNPSDRKITLVPVALPEGE